MSTHVPEPFEVELVAQLDQTPKLRAAIARAYGVAEDALPRDAISLELALHEVVVNVIEHAYVGVEDGVVRIRFEPSDEAVRVTTEDSGRPLEEPALDRAMPAAPQEGGYGLPMAQALTDRLYYEREGGTNRWELVKEHTA